MSERKKSKKHNVLLVDFYTFEREVIASSLTREKDLNVAAAGTVASAVKKISKQKTDVVVLEIESPSWDGLALCKQLATDFPKASVMILTKQQNEEYALRALRLGAKGYVLKSSETKELLEAIREIANGKVYISRQVSDKIARYVATGAGARSLSQFSDREFQVLLGLTKGKSCKELADQLDISVKTIYTYRDRILERLDLKNDIALFQYALKSQLFSGEDLPLLLGAN